MIKIYIKLFLHVISLSLFLFSAVILHVVLNSDTKFFNFYGYFIAPRAFFTDLGLMLVGIAFFIEFFMTFKPIKIIEKRDDV